MQRYQNAAQDALGNVIQGMSVTVFLKGTQTLATIYSDNGITTTPNPLATDALGMFAFYAANGHYDIQLSKTGLPTTQLQDILLFDPAGPGVVSFPDGSFTLQNTADPTKQARFSLAGFVTGVTRIFTLPNLSAVLADLTTLAASAGASLIGFLQAGVGAVLRTLQSKAQESISDFDFMTPAQIADVIAGTLTLDVSAAVWAAFDAANAAGKTLFGPAGNRRMDSNKIAAWNGRNVRWLGENAGVSAGGSQGTVYTFSVAGENFRYNGAATPTSFEMDHVKFRTTNVAAPSFGVVLNQSFNNYFRGCVFEGYGVNGGGNSPSAGIKLTGATDSVITDIDASCSFISCDIGVYSDAAGANVLHVYARFLNRGRHDIRIGDFIGSAAGLTDLVAHIKSEAAVATSSIHCTGGLVGADVRGYQEWTGNSVPFTFDSNGASGINQSIKIGPVQMVGSLAAADAFIKVANVDGLTVTDIAQLNSLAITQFLVKNTGAVGSITNATILAPSVISGGTRVATYNDGLNTYTGERFSTNGCVLSSQAPAAQVGNTADTNNDTLYTFTVSRNLLRKKGDWLDVYGSGTVAANGNNKRIVGFYAGTQFIGANIVAFNNTPWTIKYRITVVDATHVSVSGELLYSGQATTINDSINTAVADITTNDNIVKITGASTTTGAANDVLGSKMSVELKAA